MFNAWETLLNDTEAAASGYTDIAGVLGTVYYRFKFASAYSPKVRFI